MPCSELNGDVFSWLKSMPVAPEYRPTAAEFEDPIGYIFKIEKEASKYGICKIIPPFPPSPKKTAIANLNRSLPNSTFATRQQQIGFCPRKSRPVRRPVWQSGDHYTFHEFEAKAKAFEKSYLKKHSKKSNNSVSATSLETETLFWKATVDKPFSVEYANDMPGSAFSPKCRGAGEANSVANSAWNMREVSRANGSLLRFMKEEIPGVTSPMVYVAMLFSWFAWHVEDHDLHSLNYLHMGASKTWYGVPRDAAVAFEEVVRVHGYGGEINPLVTFSILGEKNTVMSPEVFISAGVPCCRLVQNAGEFVVTFPRAYHTGFSHGFNCGEAANIATPEWLRVAKDAAIRRASINYPPMVSHFQLLYDLAVALCSRIPGRISDEPRSSRLKDKKKSEGEAVIKELFVQDALRNNDLLHVVGQESAVVLLPRSSVDISVCSKLRVGFQKLKVNPGFSINICNSEGVNTSKGFVSDDLVFNRNNGDAQEKSSYSVNDHFAMSCEGDGISTFDGNRNTCTSNSKPLHRDSENETSNRDRLSDQRLFSCVTCGLLNFSCVAIVQPREAAARYLMSAGCSFFNDGTVGSGVCSTKFTAASEDANIPEPNLYSGWTEKGVKEEALNTERGNGNTALALLASAYGNSSDSEEDEVDAHESNAIDSTSGGLPSSFRDSHADPMTRLDRDEILSSSASCQAKAFMHHKFECSLSHQSFDQSYDEQSYKIPSGVAFENTRAISCSARYSSQDTHDAEQSLPVKSMVPVNSKNALLVPQCDEDSSRMHVFCLEHAAEAEQQLRPIGGAHILLLCHPDYPKIEAEAKLVAEDLGIDYTWKNIAYRHGTKGDEERIQSALDSEEAIPGNGDWAVKLGINLFYSANLSRSPLYSKQMPYNSVIYYAFGRSSQASSPIEPKVYQRRANRRIVAGKWCGKVWMSNQVHPLLAKRDLEDVRDDKCLNGWILPDVKIERSENTPQSEAVITKSGRKRKMVAKIGRIRKQSFSEEDVVLDKSSEDRPNPQPWRTLRSKQARHVEKEGAVSPGDYSPPYHCRKPIGNQTSCSESDAASDDLLDDENHMRPRRIFSVRKAKLIVNDVLSDDPVDYDSDCHQMRELRSKQVVDTERDSISENSSDAGSVQLHRKTSRGKHANYISEEDAISDDQKENCCLKQQRRIPKSRQGKCFADKNKVISDDQQKPNKQKQRLRNATSRKAKSLIEEGIISNGQMGGYCRKYQRRTTEVRQAKCVEGEDVMSDNQLEDPKRFDKEVMDDTTENIALLLHRTPKRKKAKCMDEDDMNSDDEVGAESLLHDRRTLQSKQSRPKTVKQMNQSEFTQVKNQTPLPVKRGTRDLMKSKASQQVKKPSHLRNKQSGSSRESSLHMEEEEGGPSTRLRKRVQKAKESEENLKSKQTKRKKVTVTKVSAGNAKPDEEAEYQCDIEGCTMGFGSKQELTNHKKNICPVKGCGKKFFSHKYLVQHRRVHEDDRPLKCPWKGCKMTFKWAWARTEHIRVHTGARPYVCAEPGCGQTFRFVSDFSRHKRKTGHLAKSRQ